MVRKLAVLLVTMCILLAAGCNSNNNTAGTNADPDPAQNQKLALSVAGAPGPVSYPLAYMVQDNPDLDVQPWKTYDQLLSMITAKQVKLASSPINNAIMAYNKGFNIKLVNVSVWGMLYVVSSDSSIKEIKDLKGKEIAVHGQGNIHDLVFRHLLIQNGLDPDTDVQITYMDLSQASAQLITGEVKYAVLNEPNASMALLNAKNSGVELARVIDLQEEWAKIPGQENNRIPQAGYVAVVEAGVTPDEIAAFQASYSEAAKWVNEHQAEIGPMVENQTEWMKAAAVSESLKYANLQPVAAADCQDEVIAFFNELSKTAPAAALGGKQPDANFFFQE
ncbi:MAG: ABC transporter substrate-binding protein [Lawsonibacter sp.]|jgi:NitT/TauT family transport system substrate-binding protein